jgi:hypothetical protein
LVHLSLKTHHTQSHPLPIIATECRGLVLDEANNWRLRQHRLRIWQITRVVANSVPKVCCYKECQHEIDWESGTCKKTWGWFYVSYSVWEIGWPASNVVFVIFQELTCFRLYYYEGEWNISTICKVVAQENVTYMKGNAMNQRTLNWGGNPKMIRQSHLKWCFGKYGRKRITNSQSKLTSLLQIWSGWHFQLLHVCAFDQNPSVCYIDKTRQPGVSECLQSGHLARIRPNCCWGRNYLF